MAVTIEPVKGTFVRRVTDIDLDKEISDEDRALILKAWIEAGVLIFPGLGKSNEALFKLSCCFGELEIAPTKSLLASDNPYLLDLSYNPDRNSTISDFYVELNGEQRAGYLGWHWDMSYTPGTVRGAVLRMVETPERGGETGFIDAVGAYERLPAALKQRLEGLEVVYLSKPEWNPICYGAGVVKKEPPPERLALEGDTKRTKFPPTVHPMVITQRETGRKILKLSPMLCGYVLGWDQQSSQALFEEIAGYLLDERYAYFHHWRVNDLVAWDNWRTIHTACGVPPHMRRMVVRTTILDEYKLGRLLEPV